eukprot:TRINITY_DN6499_c0_g1_i1.p1 TRINITY_DN6499_c0_g1~~TRINITY_DN6499_c0_g1_i1.p1  ORF type:complete len:376 (+),score=-0.30 TRINITY_DN6499_c0_g1_i1:403-1530(+)
MAPATRASALLAVLIVTLTVATHPSGSTAAALSHRNNGTAAAAPIFIHPMTRHVLLSDSAGRIGAAADRIRETVHEALIHRVDRLGGLGGNAATPAALVGEGQAITSGCGQSPCTTTPSLCDVMNSPVNVYLIWFGSFSDGEKNTLRNFVKSLSDTSDASNTVPLWWNTNRLYTDCSGNPVSATVAIAGEASDHPNRQFLFMSRSVIRLVDRIVSAGKLPVDKNGVYFVVGDGRTKQRNIIGGFCRTFCGWHSTGSIKGVDLKVSFVAKPNRCMKGCSAPALLKASSGPSGNKAMDSLVSVFAHELAEATSDPYLHTWVDASGNENADICAYKYGTTLTASSGAPYNLVGINGLKFLVQQNYHPQDRKCVTTTAA